MSGRAQNETPADLATQIAALMRRMGVPGLPRNYEIFYEATTGSNDALRADLAALGPRPTQAGLDQIAMTHFAQNSGQTIVENARDQIAQKLEEILVLVNKERNSLENYGRILDETSDGLNSRNLISRELLQKIVGIMVAATDVTVTQGKQTISSMEDKSAELETVKSKLEEYKKLAETDPLTGLRNRRAFDKAMARVYSSPRNVMFHALILADIDRFKEVNDRFGHPAGDRVLQQMAAILRAHTQSNVFLARTGGEEFALIVDGGSVEAVQKLAERIRAAVGETSFSEKAAIAGCGPVTLSVGICMASQADDPTDLYAKADRALYASKVNGRNRVTAYAESTPRRGKDWLIYRKD